MNAEQRTDWWSRGEMCETCNTWFCHRHRPYSDDAEDTTEVGPLGTTGLESEMFGPIEVFFLDRHTNHSGTRTSIGEAVYRGKSYDGKPGNRQDADSVASAAAIWLGKLFAAEPHNRPDVIMAVPPKRGRNGICLPVIIADAVGRDLGIPVVAPFQWRNGTAQAKALPFDERQRALSAMLEQVGSVSAGTVMVVDDVLQTGATIAVVARQLVALGATKVTAFAPSRASAARGRHSR